MRALGPISLLSPQAGITLTFDAPPAPIALRLDTVPTATPSRWTPPARPLSLTLDSTAPGSPMNAKLTFFFDSHQKTFDASLTIRLNFGVGTLVP